GLSRGVEDLDAMVVRVRDEDMPAGGIDAARLGEEARVRAPSAPGQQEPALGVELLAAAVPLIAHVEAPIQPHRDIDGPAELPLLVTVVPDVEEEPPLGIEDLNAVVPRVGHVDAARSDRDAQRVDEFPGAG